MKQKLVIFGTGAIAQIAADYFERDTSYEVVAFTVDKAFLTADKFHDKPVVAFEEVVTKYPSSDHHIFVAVSYAQMNVLRADRVKAAKLLGYKPATYISPRCSYLSHNKPGENCFIFEDNTIQPYVEIGNNVIIWSGNHIGHHSKIADNNFISSHVVISGHCEIKENCFLGVNSTLAHGVTIGRFTLVGAAAVIASDTVEYSVHVPPRSVVLEKKSTDIKM